MKKFILTLIALTFISIPVAHAQTATNNVVYVDVNGLVCDFCARALEKVFGKQDEVADIDVNLDTKVITINYKEGQSLEDEKVKSLINDAGYNVVNIRHEAPDVVLNDNEVSHE